MNQYPLRDGDEIDRIAFEQYGELPGAVEALLRANWDLLPYIDNLGRVGPMPRPLMLKLPDLKKPTEITQTVRLFD